MSLSSIFSFHIEKLIYPQFCKKCETPLTQKESLFCRLCLTDNLELTKLGNWVKDLKTNDCIDEAISLFWFNSIVQDCIHHLKYHQFKMVISNILDLACNNNWIDIENYSFIVPIPLHSVKLRERGFNQAEVVARILSHYFNVPINTKILKRTLYTNTQTKLNITERRLNVHNAFQCDKIVKGNVLLVDDVLTTGATSSACAHSLKEKGCKKVDIFTLATPIIES